MRGRPPHDPERRVALKAALGSLQGSWTVEHEAYMRSGGMVGRRISDDLVRSFRREMLCEIKRLRSALRRTSGTPREPAPTVSAASMSGRIAQSLQVIRGIDADHEKMRAVLGSGQVVARRGGGFYRSMHRLNAEAEAMLDKLRTERERVNLAWQRYERNAGRSYAEQDAHHDLADRMALLRQDAALITAELTASMRQQKPHAAPKRGQWNFRAINAAIDAYRAKHGRRPTKREFNSDPTLPHYTQVRRVLGPNPLRVLDL